MFLSARDQLAAQQNEAIEGLRGDMLSIANENRQMQSQLAQVGSASAPSTSQAGAYRPEDISQSSHQAAVLQLAQGDNMSQQDGSRGPSRGNALVDAASVVGPRHEAARQCKDA